MSFYYLNAMSDLHFEFSLLLIAQCRGKRLACNCFRYRKGFHMCGIILNNGFSRTRMYLPRLSEPIESGSTSVNQGNSHEPL